MKNKELERSSELAAYFLPRQEEPSMLSSTEVNNLLTRHQAEMDYQARLAKWNRRSGFTVGIISFGGATAVALATYFLFFVGAVHNNIAPYVGSESLSFAVSSSSPSPSRDKNASESNEPIQSTANRIVYNIASSNKELTRTAAAKENRPQVPDTTNQYVNNSFCLSALSYRVDTVSISVLVPHQFAIAVNPPIHTISGVPHRVTYQHDANSDLLGNLYSIGYQTFANPVISAYDTVRSVSERTLASLNMIVAHP